MSLGARATKGGAKPLGKEKQERGRPSDKPKEKQKPQATTEQLRMASIIDRKYEDNVDVRMMVLELMEMTRRTEDEVCSALHDTDNDMELACDMLLEEKPTQGEWQTNEKKKKKSPSTGNGDVDPPLPGQRSRSGPRQRREGGGDGQRGRGSGRGRGSARGGRAGGRGAGRARGGAPPRRSAEHWGDTQDTNFGPTTGNFQSNEDWESDDKFVQPLSSSFPATDDWDNDEWSGSLADTKVFTQSGPPPEQDPAANISTENWEDSTSGSPSNNGLASEAAQINYTYHNSTHQISQLDLIPQTAESVGGLNSLDNAAMSVTSLNHQGKPPQVSQPIGLSGSLSAAQSQYLSQLTQQTQLQNTSVYTTNYGVYGSTELTQRKPQRARLPPPSKIPSSAVEMPGGGDTQTSFIDVQFGALEPDALDNIHTNKSTPSDSMTPSHSTHETVAADTNSYSNAASMLSDTLSGVEAMSSSQAVTADTTSTSAATLESRLTASMKQLSTEEAPATDATQPHAYAYQQRQYPRAAPKHQTPTVGQQQSVYPTHHPVYGANVYVPQVNSTNPSLTVASAMTSAYPPAVTLPQYHTQPLNSYQQTSSSASVYGGSALYTPAAPYAAYQPAASKVVADKPAYERTTQAATVPAPPKVTAAQAKVTSASNVSTAQYTVPAQPQPQAFYTQQQGQAYAAYAAAEEAQLMRGTLPHHMVNNGGYYEVGYGVSGMTPAREPAAGFGLGGGERFGRADASSPQQVAAALPPGYTYYFQPQPNPYQYGVYPYGGGGSNVTGVTGVTGVSGAAGKVAGYSQQQPQYDAQLQDNYKQGGYSAAGKVGADTAATNLSSVIYAKHAQLNKAHSYDKAAFHSATPPPFGGGTAPHHLYVHHQPHHQHQQESGASAARAGSGKPAATKPYSQSYWAPN